MNMSRFFSGFVLATALVTSGNLVQAQSLRPSGVASLGEMGCLAINANRGSGKYNVINDDFSVSLQVLRAVAYLGGGSHRHRPPAAIGTKYSTQVACRLAAPGEEPKLKTLSLTLGIPDSSYLEGYPRLSVYKDGNFTGYKDVRKGELTSWIIDVKNTRSIALEGECVRSNHNECPAIFFFEDILE